MTLTFISTLQRLNQVSNYNNNNNRHNNNVNIYSVIVVRPMSEFTRLGSFDV